ncbi:MAG TPA: zinc-binding dehydrogenase [Bacteroidia bacterium]|nr:zinc-binding dehydrogenase [Bacteroidia bacterium]
MKAFVLQKAGPAATAFEFKEQPDPRATKGTVIVETEAFGINYADVVARKGMYKDAPPIPCVIGYEAAGRIVEVGEGVDHLKVGMRVACFTRFGGYATRVLAAAAGVVPIPEDMEVGIALALMVQYSTAWYCAEYATRILPGDHVLVQAAAGGVGTALVQIAKWRGAVVYGTAGSEAKLAYLRGLGVDHPINYNNEDYVAKIQQLRGKAGVDIVYDSLGGKEFNRGFKLLGPGGRIVGMGSASREGKGILADIGTLFGFGRYWAAFLLLQSRAIIGCNMLRVADHRPEVLQYCLQGVLKAAAEGHLKPTVGKVFTATELVAAHEYVEQRKSMGKVIVTW